MLWDVVLFEEALYVTTGAAIYCRKAGQPWQRVAHGFPEEKKNDFWRLEIGFERLWIMGTKRLFSFDGTSWHCHPDPDNG